MRQQITDSLINARKQLLSQAYMAMAMDEAKIENLLAKQVVENPNEFKRRASGWRGYSGSDAGGKYQYEYNRQRERRAVERFARQTGEREYEHETGEHAGGKQ